MKELEKQRAKRIELSIDLLLEDSSIYFAAQEEIEGLFIDQINFMFMTFDKLPNMYEDVLVSFKDIDLYGMVVSKNYHVAFRTLYINLELKLEE